MKIEMGKEYAVAILKLCNTGSDSRAGTWTTFEVSPALDADIEEDTLHNNVVILAGELSHKTGLLIVQWNGRYLNKWRLWEEVNSG